MDGLELKLSPELQDALRTRAAAHERSLEDEAKALLQAALEQDALAKLDPLEQLSILSEAQLWQLARQQVPGEKSERMQGLSERLQAEGLTLEETEEVKRLQAYAQRIMLFKAEAAALLKRRGRDVSGLRVRPD